MTIHPFRWRWRRLLLFAVILLIPSCSGGTFTEKQINDLKLIGQSREEVLRLFGRPDFIGKNIDYTDKGKAGPTRTAAEKWEYPHLVTNPAGGHIFLAIYFDKDGKVGYYELPVP